MSYSLEAVRRIVDDCLNGEELNFSSVSNSSYSAGLKNAVAEISSFKSFFLQKAVGMNGETLKIWVNISAVNCIDLLNNMYHLIHVTPKKAFRDDETAGEFAKLESALLDQVFWLRDYFASCFSEDQYLPAILAQNTNHELNSLVTALRHELQSAGIPLNLVSIIAPPAADGPLPASYTFRQLTYYKTLYTDTKKMITVATGENAHQAIINGLIHHNFNDPAFISHLIRELQKEVEENSSIENQCARWALYKKKYQQIQVSGLSLYPGAATAKEALIAAISEEINYLQQARSALAQIYGSNANASPVPLNPKASTLLTTLSVSQLAVFCRLLSDCNIIQHSNQTGLLKMIAGSLQTTRTLTISPESLRVKYYAPDSAAINIVKEHLLQMLSQLKKY